jgi:uncharacterized GH25 family protein
MKSKFLVSALFLGFATQIFAHQLWLERDGMVIKEYFGHFPNFKEKEDGKRLKAIKGDVLSPKKAYVSTQRADEYVKVQINSKGDVGLTEEMSPRKGKFVDFVVRTIFLAREGRGESKNLLALDLVPQSPNSNTFTILLDGKPLPKTKVHVIAPNTWSKSFSSDEAGVVSIKTPWSGDYVVQVDYTDKTKGEVQGKAYEQTNYVMTLHFKVD